MNKKEYVLGFAFSPGRDLVALIRKRRPEWQAGRLNGIGGKVEPGESVFDAMTREFAEEAGNKTEHTQWRLFCVLEGGDWRVHCFRGDGIHYIHTQTDERVEWFFVHALRTESTIPNLKWLIPLALDEHAPVAHVTQ